MTKEKKITVKVEALNVSYGENTILKDLEFSIKENEFFVLVGKSGSGKTTLLKSIAGLLDYNGEIETKGDLRLVFQDDRLLPWLKVSQNIQLGIPTHNNSHIEKDHKLSIETKEKIAQVSEHLGIEDLLRKYPDQISGGEKQRVSIARAFISEPQIVLMDEPFKSLDIFTKENIYDWLLNFWRELGSSIIYVTHDLEEALLLGDRVALLQDGQIIKNIEVPFDRPRNNDIKYTVKFTEYRKMLAASFK